MVSLQTAIFTGFALGLGASESTIAHFISIGSFSSLAQILSSTFLVGRLQHKKAFVIAMGCLHTLFRFAVVLVPLVMMHHQLWVIGVLIGVGMVCWHSAGPIFSGWNAQIIPEDTRARFLGQQTMANLILGIVTSYVAGWYLDMFPEPEKYTGFFTIFLVATLIGMGGFLNLSRVPFRSGDQDNLKGSLLTPFRDARFRNLLIFFWIWNFSWSVASPFYSVFMLKTLQISYTTVAVLSSLGMASMAIGSRVLSGLIDRYGSKAMLQILVLPGIFTPVLWVFSRPDFYYFIPVAMILNGMVFAGVMVSVNALLYGTVPETGNRTAYFASWSSSVFLSYAFAPLLGSALVEVFRPYHWVLMGFDIGYIQMVFLVSAALMVIPNVLLRAIEDNKDTTPRELLRQVGRGNLVGYLYNSTVFDWARNEQNRAHALHQMGRSRSPMALYRLIQALSDASPEVRRQAARGLGESQSPEAVSVLLNALRDKESDIRSEAIEALGKLGNPEVIDSLVEALDDEDTRVCTSAIRALSEMGGEEAHELLFWKFADRFDRATFPTLADVLGAGRDLRMVRPTLERLSHFHSSAIRLQLLNSVCRALGGGRRFYRLVSQDPLARAEQMGDLIKRTRLSLRKDRVLPKGVRADVLAQMDAFREAYDRGDAAASMAAAQTLAERLKTGVDETIVADLREAAASRVGASVLAIETFLSHVAKAENEDMCILYLTVVLWCIGDTFRTVN